MATKLGTVLLLLAFSCLLVRTSLGQDRPQSAPSSPQQSSPPQAKAPTPDTAGQPAKPQKPLTLREKAQIMLEDGVHDPSADRRAHAVAALGLLQNDRKARQEALRALKDDKSEVRAAAATALGSMHASQARRELVAALDDSNPSVVLAAANSLLQLKDPIGYQVYYQVLTGEQKVGRNFVQREFADLHDKRKVMQLGLDEGIGFVPFAGIPYTVLKMVLKDDSAQVRVVAAQNLANDPNPNSGFALIQALSDKNWVVRVTALKALAHRRHSILLPQIAPSLDDEKEEVRYFAAACVLQLDRVKDARRQANTHAAANTKLSNPGAGR